MFNRERRKCVRRQSDRELLAQLDQYRRKLSEKEGEDETQRQFRQMRRHAIRHNCTVHIAAQMHTSSAFGDTWDVSEFRIKGRVLDLSEEGCSIFVQQPMEIGQQLNLIFGFGRNSKVQTVGLVRWTKAMPEKGGIALGVQFTKLDGKVRKSILAFLTEVDRTMGL